jgi:2-dehydropantoate 2-reductase
MELKNILICGIGGVGGYFGGKIAHELSQLVIKASKIYFLARGQHLKKIRENGLELHTSDNETLICTPTLASDNINDFPSPDLCFICVKSYDLDDLINILKNIITEKTVIIPLMNGIDIYERIRINLKIGMVLPTCVYVGSHVEKPGLVIQSGNPGFFHFGRDPKYPKFNPRILQEFLHKMGIKSEWKVNPYNSIWEKYILVSSFALVCTHTGQTMGGVIYDNNHIKMVKDLMKEIILIAEKKGIHTLSKNIIEDTIEFCKDYPDIKPSYQRDIEKGRKNEGDLFGGTIIRLGKSLGIPTPITASIYKET